MNNLWRGIAIFGIWASAAYMSRFVNSVGVAVCALIAAFFMVFEPEN